MSLCECGCGKPAPIATETSRKYGWVKDQSLRYIRGHNNRGRHLKPQRYSEEDRGFSTPCWIWQLQIMPNGYGSVSVNRRPYRAHRFYWEQLNGPVPEGLVLDHLCRVRACVNPEHLEAVTHPENCHRGVGVKLTPDNVRAIRRLLADGVSGNEIAVRFGVSPMAISSIKTGRSWRSVP